MRRWLVLGLWFGPAAFAGPIGDHPGGDYAQTRYHHALNVGLGALGPVGEGRLSRADAVGWTVVYAWAPARPLAVEVVHSGGLNPLRHKAVFVGTLETDLRVNVVPLTNVYPFVAMGLGTGAFRGMGEEASVELTTVTLPLTAGLEILNDRTSFQWRFTGRPTWFDDRVAFTPRGADTWQFVGSLGTRF